MWLEEEKIQGVCILGIIAEKLPDDFKGHREVSHSGENEKKGSFLYIKGHFFLLICSKFFFVVEIEILQ